MFRYSNRTRWIALVLLVVVSAPTVLFGFRTYSSFVLLRSAYEAGAPTTSSVRAWMTLRYVATRYRVPAAQLIAHLQLQPETDPDRSLRSLAESSGLSPFAFVQRTQRAVADLPA